MAFRQGWYQTRRETGGPNEGRVHCRYFVDASTYSAQCIVEANGAQILTWQAQDPSHYRKAAWSSEYVKLASAKSGDWWDNPATSAGYNPDIPGDYSREKRKPTARELCQRASHVDPAATDGLQCSTEIHVGIFFDGTNNNMERDRPLLGHSNIVSLFDAHKDDRKTCFRYYIPGVGTPFRQIGETTESDDGKAFATGGESRIYWAMLLVYNAVCRAATRADLLQEAEMTQLVTSYGGGLKTAWHLGNDKARTVLRGVHQRLLTAVEGRRPTVLRLNLSVFGFSRGAAQARTFCNWLQEATGGMVGTAALRLRFVGLFDTVASVGLADSSPVGTGFMDWADGTMEIQGVERGLHYVAAHEIRRSFPLSTARGQGGIAVSGLSEYIYPGAHSDLGGGYSPGDQGKAAGARAKLLSQIPLNDMHFEAINAGTELKRKDQLPLEIKSDFVVDEGLDSAFAAYTQWTTQLDEKADDVASRAKAEVDGRMQYHMQLYWRWRASKQTDAQFKQMVSYRTASAQDKQDLWEAEGDWRRDMEQARRAVETPAPRSTVGAVSRALYQAVKQQVQVPPLVDAFFDQHVHDSHAGFWLLGPQTTYDRQVYINEVKAKQKTYEELTELARTTTSPEASVALHAQALTYQLNNFERRVLDVAAAGSAQFPLMTDADAADMASHKGIKTQAALWAMGTGTRREANGHGQYRRLFDRS
ncbi:DUF2235 domain-containing protein [Xanthomonas oryzae pv. oryzicola]|uniref:T6SS phospholipase effector Tle1-like catalytic domain-containing protein n=1 Tax=Xanthomonas oryzae TaxID=347 RepID=UPI00129ABADE|nr:DUF2235 domain-containing protein [Xanthomonas oryzae]QGH66924.1 DUF2235 domain-containing protein [Xanthomonas oryzae pv. oryzicola]